MYHGTNVMYKSKPRKHVYPDNTPEICDAFPETHKYFWVNMRQTNVFWADIRWLLNSRICPRIGRQHLFPETVNQSKSIPNQHQVAHEFQKCVSELADVV